MVKKSLKDPQKLIEDIILSKKHHSSFKKFFDKKGNSLFSNSRDIFNQIYELPSPYKLTLSMKRTENPCSSMISVIAH
jgi:hypothetical protein